MNKIKSRDTKGYYRKFNFGEPTPNILSSADVKEILSIILQKHTSQESGLPKPVKKFLLILSDFYMKNNQKLIC